MAERSQMSAGRVSAGRGETRVRRPYHDPPLLSRAIVVVGIARDVAGFRLGGVRLCGADSGIFSHSSIAAIVVGALGA